MPVKIRLQRHGKKGKPFYWIVAADARSKRDGKYLEKLGTYNPNVKPAAIALDVDGAVKWLQNGAQPTDTARAILSYKGVLLKKHLAGGVLKGALTEEEAEQKFAAWSAEKEGKINAHKEGVVKDREAAKAIALAAETKINEERIAAVKEAEEAVIKAEADAKAAAAAAEAAANEAAEEAAPETIDEAQAAASQADTEVAADKPADTEEAAEPTA